MGLRQAKEGCGGLREARQDLSVLEGRKEGGPSLKWVREVGRSTLVIYINRIMRYVLLYA